MKKAIFAALVLLSAAALTLVAGRGNNVTHYDERTGEMKFISPASAGNCRHHLSAHPNDTVTVVGGQSKDPNDCN